MRLTHATIRGFRCHTVVRDWSRSLHIAFLRLMSIDLGKSEILRQNSTVVNVTSDRCNVATGIFGQLLAVGTRFSKFTCTLLFIGIAVWLGIVLACVL